MNVFIVDNIVLDGTSYNKGDIVIAVMRNETHYHKGRLVGWSKHSITLDISTQYTADIKDILISDLDRVGTPETISIPYGDDDE